MDSLKVGTLLQSIIGLPLEMLSYQINLEFACMLKLADYYQEFIIYIERRVSYFSIPCTNAYREVITQYLLSHRRCL